MAFDECVENPRPMNTPRPHVKGRCWLHRCRDEMTRLNAEEGTLNPRQMLFGINQGSIYEELRVQNMKEIACVELDGFAIEGLW